MKVLVIGSGGREHALAWKLADAADVTEVFVAPGNGGTATEPGLSNLAINDLPELVAWSLANHVDLVVVGPEAPLAAGAVDLFRAADIPVFGPTQAAAQLESSKAFSKGFMARHGIPTAAFETFSDPAQAHAYIDKQGAPIVVKADGLAAGKGVVVAMTAEEAHLAVDDMLLSNTLGVTHNADGARVVIEEFLVGEEASFMVVCDGTTVLPLATSQDHKRLGRGDTGPNTGGMGAYSPAPVVTDAVHKKAMEAVILPTIAGMRADGIPFTGFLYAGLMISPAGEVKTLEFNCRMGDPETQPIMMRLSSSLAELMLAGATGQLADVVLAWDERPAMG
ncbi:MAG: phosphoribosylamine--glycine ligase, partial [Burkholderiaceae bacterium]|nr:phosphoribosylamine--glycine ligase [Burkholderiaceae bacterium]